MDYLFMGIAVIIIIAALLYFRHVYFSPKSSSKNVQKKVRQNSGFVNCPVCSTPLLPGENIVSKVFTTTGQVNDQICYIYGCSHCFPVVQTGVTRSCPVCHKAVEQKQYLLARRFNKTKSGTPHIIVNGCGNCNRH